MVRYWKAYYRKGMFWLSGCAREMNYLAGRLKMMMMMMMMMMIMMMMMMMMMMSYIK